MSLPVYEIVLVFTVLVILLGYSVLRSARAASLDRSSETRICPTEGCRHRNPPEAAFCAKCGRRLPRAASRSK